MDWNYVGFFAFLFLVLLVPVLIWLAKKNACMDCKQLKDLYNDRQLAKNCLNDQCVACKTKYTHAVEVVYILWLRSTQADHYTIYAVYEDWDTANADGVNLVEFEDYDGYLVNERNLI